MHPQLDTLCRAPRDAEMLDAVAELLGVLDVGALYDIRNAEVPDPTGHSQSS